nr:TRAP transporter small permease [Carnobacterium gallinarum]
MKKNLDRFLEIIVSSILSVMLLVVIWQVISRTVLKNPNTITEEFVRFSLVWFAMLASAYVVGKKSHLSVTLLSDKLIGKSKWILEVIVELLFLLFAAIIMIYGGVNAVNLTMQQISPSLSIPMGYIYLSVPVAGCLIIVYSVLNLIELAKGAKSQT